MVRTFSFLAGALFLALAGGCNSSTATAFPQCTLKAALTPTQGAPGDEITSTGGEYTEVYDTVVTVGGTQGTVTDVNRTGCNLCDLCRQAAANLGECDACQTCFECSSYCDNCVQVVTFNVPEVTPGNTTVVVQDRYGASDGIPFLVLAGDTGTADTGTADTGSTDTGAVDTGTADTGTTDTASSR